MRYLIWVCLAFCFAGCSKATKPADREAAEKSLVDSVDISQPSLPDEDRFKAEPSSEPITKAANSSDPQTLDADKPKADSPKKTLQLSPDVITVLSPKDGATVHQKYSGISLSGHIENYQPGWILLATNFLAAAEIEANGNFITEIFPDAGENTIDLVLYDGIVQPPSELTRKQITLYYLPDSDAAAQIEAGDAGKLIVTDAASTINGVSFELPAGAINETLMFTLSSDPAHFPNLPFDYIGLSEPVSLTPYGYKLNSDGILQIPYKISALPEGASYNEVVILTIDDTNDWKELPVLSTKSGSVSANVDALHYDPYVAAVKKLELTDSP